MVSSKNVTDSQVVENVRLISEEIMGLTAWLSDLFDRTGIIPAPILEQLEKVVDQTKGLKQTIAMIRLKQK